jgi:uncharacterized protein
VFLLGTLVNSGAIIFGSLLGFFIPTIPERMKDTIMTGLALCVALIGLGMALQGLGDILYIIVSIVLGTLLGEVMQIEGQLEKFGAYVEKRLQRVYQGPIAEAFVAASLLYCVGSMAIVGAIQDGMLNNHETLLAKAMLDGFSAIVFTSTLGIGVLFSAIPILLYEGTIALVAHIAGSGINDPALITCMSATGGLLIVGIGINLIGVKKIAVGNMLPSMFVAPILKWLMSAFFIPFIHQLMH